MGPNKWMFLLEIIASTSTTTTTTTTTTASTTTTSTTTTTTITTTTTTLPLCKKAMNVYEWKHYIDVYSSCIIYGTNYFYDHHR